MKLRKRGYVGTTSPAVTEREIVNGALARRAASEGFVLLKNEGHVLPLQKGTALGLYGGGAVKTVKGGTGSGDVNNRGSITIYQGLKTGVSGLRNRRPHGWLPMNPVMIRPAAAGERKFSGRQRKNAGGISLRDIPLLLLLFLRARPWIWKQPAGTEQIPQSMFWRVLPGKMQIVMMCPEIIILQKKSGNSSPRSALLMKK